MFSKSIFTLLFITILVSGCNSSSSSANKTVKEFISLDKKANYETGSITIDNKTTVLSYTGSLEFRTNPQGPYEGSIGLGLFEEKSLSPVVIMSNEGERPDFQGMLVNIPNSDDGYTCNQISYEEKKSTKITDATIFLVEASNCDGTGANVGLTKDISMTLTESMFVGGTSQISITDGKALLVTEIPLSDNLLISGGLGTRAYNQIFDLITNNPEVKTLVEGHISGSLHDDINMQTGRLVRKAGLSTHLTSTSDIASGGVDLFCSGKKRTMEEGAKLRVHSWAGRNDEGDTVEAIDLPIDSPLHNNQIEYFTEMLGSPIGKDFYFYTINAAPAGATHLMLQSEIDSFGILTNDQ